MIKPNPAPANPTHERYEELLIEVEEAAYELGQLAAVLRSVQDSMVFDVLRNENELPAGESLEKKIEDVQSRWPIGAIAAAALSAFMQADRLKDVWSVHTDKSHPINQR